MEEKVSGGEYAGNAELVIYPLKKIAKEGIMALKLEREKLEIFKGLLTECVEEIFNRDIPFFANPDEKRCGYCGHRAICGK